MQLTTVFFTVLYAGSTLAAPSLKVSRQLTLAQVLGLANDDLLAILGTANSAPACLSRFAQGGQYLDQVEGCIEDVTDGLEQFEDEFESQLAGVVLGLLNPDTASEVAGLLDTTNTLVETVVDDIQSGVNNNVLGLYPELRPILVDELNDMVADLGPVLTMATTLVALNPLLPPSELNAIVQEITTLTNGLTTGIDAILGTIG
ncbi:hypothetical protein F4810DRAFT_715832 [Camillea tinctor]|nr:hypothetical protein F4810DRAFT_715832 [Camillea tinctor]